VLHAGGIPSDRDAGDDGRGRTGVPDSRRRLLLRLLVRVLRRGR
jgi:hypothetical protein